MGLKDYQPETEVVKLGKANSFTVRGLSTRDISKLLRAHTQDVEMLFSVYSNLKKTSTDDAFMNQVIGVLIGDMPMLTTELLVLCSDEEHDAASRAAIDCLPMPVQMDALMKIFKLTFEEVGGVKKWAQSTLSLVANMGFRRLNLKELNTLVESKLQTSS